MTSLIPRDHFFQDLFDFRRDFDQIFNRFLSRPSAQEESAMTTAGFSPATGSFIEKDGGKFHCQVMLPGVDSKNANLQVQGNALTISGERSDCRGRFAAQGGDQVTSRPCRETCDRVVQTLPL